MIVCLNVKERRQNDEEDKGCVENDEDDEGRERERKRMKVRGEVTTRPKYGRGVFIYPNCDVGLVTLPAKQRKIFCLNDDGDDDEGDVSSRSLSS